MEVGGAIWILADASTLSLAQRGRAEPSGLRHVEGVRSQDHTHELRQVLTFPLTDKTKRSDCHKLRNNFNLKKSSCCAVDAFLCVFL